MFYTKILAKIHRLKFNPAVSGNDLFNIPPAVVASEDPDDQRVAAVIERSHETRPRGPGVSGLAVNLFLPPGKKDLVVAFERDLAAVAGIDRFIFSLDRLPKKTVLQGF